MKRRGILEGWPIVGWVSLLLALLVGAVLRAEGWDESTFRIVIRSTALLSLLLFTTAFVASSLRRLWPNAATAWMLRNRRYLGVSFAMSHFTHLAAILALMQASPSAREQTGMVTIVGGSLAYVFLIAMTVTSFDRTTAWLGARRWKLLHTTGVYLLWAVFFVTYLPRAIGAPPYLPLVGLLLISLALRIFVRFAPRGGLAVRGKTGE